MKNIEIKYRVQSVEKLCSFLIGDREVRESWRHMQKDIYYPVPNGRLKLRIESDSEAQLIFYRRTDARYSRESNYHIYRTKNPAELNVLLQEAFGVRGTVEKERRLLLFRNVRIHLDRVKDLGEFLEFESVVSGETDEATARDNLGEIQRRLSGFEMTPEAQSYADLLVQLGNGNEQ